MLCVSPVQRFITETLQCLGFGSRARQVARGQVKKRRGTAAPLQQTIGKWRTCTTTTTDDTINETNSSYLSWQNSQIDRTGCNDTCAGNVNYTPNFGRVKYNSDTG